MAKINWDADNKRRRMRDHGAEFVDAEGMEASPFDSHSGKKERGSTANVQRAKPERNPSTQENRRPRPETPFERACSTFLREHAFAVTNNRPVPAIPAAIKKRYPGKKAMSWKTLTLRSPRYSEELRRARKAKEVKDQAYKPL